MKHLPKHLQPRWRYLGVEVESWPDASLSRGAFQRELWYAAQNLYGDAGSAEVDLSVLEFQFADGVGATVVRARRGEVDRARAALACIDSVAGSPVGVRVRGVAGTVRACEERYLGRRAGASEERTVVLGTETRPAVCRGPLLDVRGLDGFTGATEFDFE
jgi:ribonuclease P/MRP protein subunit POP5